MKSLIRHRQVLSFLLAAMMVVAGGTRLYLTHNQGFDASAWDIHLSDFSEHEQLRCNCPICHAEDFVATEAETFEYHTFITTLSYEFAIYQTAAANDIVVLSSLRGPPCVS